MGRFVVTESSVVEICEAWEAGENDPSMQEWLQLPVASGVCPYCKSTHFGTLNCRGYFQVRHCNDQFRVGCRAHWRDEVTPHMISEIIGALCGEQRRFGMGKADTAFARGLLERQALRDAVS